MGLTSISSICELGKVSLLKADLVTPFALDRSSRTDDDTYGEKGEEADRGMEEEEPDESGLLVEALSSSDPESAVDLFA